MERSHSNFGAWRFSHTVQKRSFEALTCGAPYGLCFARICSRIPGEGPL